MQVTLRDGSVFIYTVGVLVTGMWLTGGRPEITPVVVVAGALLAAFWTAYFKWKLEPQFVPDEESEESADAPGESAAPDE